MKPDEYADDFGSPAYEIARHIPRRRANGMPTITVDLSIPLACALRRLGGSIDISISELKTVGVTPNIIVRENADGTGIIVSLVNPTDR
jgi:hypothetical protein